MFGERFFRKVAGEKREYVNTDTGKAEAVPVVGADGVVHLAAGPAEEIRAQATGETEFKEAA
jgi:hypothetical protein